MRGWRRSDLQPIHCPRCRENRNALEAFQDKQVFVAGDDEVSLRGERLNVHDFISIADARALIEAWQQDYNRFRPQGALGHLTPSEFAERGQTHDPKVASLHF
ncbi:MAG: transposase [Nevskia sp.]|nr:transposase [Nevskia sp.]